MSDGHAVFARIRPTNPPAQQLHDRLRTTNPRVFAVGDVAGGLQFTQVAAWHAGIVIRQAMFGLPAKADPRAIPPDDAVGTGLGQSRRLGPASDPAGLVRRLRLGARRGR